MTPKLYMVPQSPPVRAVQMTAKAIGLDLELYELDMKTEEHLSPKYLKLNPQHTIPTLVDDDGFTIWESHAIMPYLISKYAKDDSLYPADIKKRAMINQRLHFESGVLFKRGRKFISPILAKIKQTWEKEDEDSIHEAYGFLEAFLRGHDWVAGDFVSIADFSIISSTTSINVLIPIDSRKYPNVTAWLARMQTLPAYEANVKGLQMFADHIKSLIIAQ